MMGKPSSSSSSKQSQIHRVGLSMENNKLKQEPRLSGAYIRSLVKHLTTSVKTKDHSFNGDHKVTDSLPKSVDFNRGHVATNRNDMQQESTLQPPPPPHKKQVRRRQQTNKPYQERLLNMAEARREIVTALKFHRASMKQRQSTVNNSHLSDQSPRSTTTSAASSYLEHYSSSPLVPNYWSIVSTTPTVSHDNLDFTLPNQTLGLNLNFHDFKNLDGNLYLNYSTSSSSAASSFSSPSTSSSAVISLVTEQMAADVPEEEVVATNTTTSSTTSTTSSSVSDGLHHAMDEEAMEEIRSLGEQHQLEWDDTVNLLMSARWYKFLKTFEMEQEDGKFDQVMEFPDCMDISEIEGMDGEWLA